MTTLRVGSASDVGLVRSNNQDQLLVASPLFAVADGMGGHAAGEVASLTAIEAMRAAFDTNRTFAGLVAAAKQANRSVWEKAQHDPDYRGMGTTLVALALVTEDDEARLAIVNIGDSRLYRLRQGELEQLTTDHRLVQELIDEGQLTEADATMHPQRHVLTRAVGVDPEVAVDSMQVLPFKGDRFLLCSDGLSGEVSDSQMASVLRRLADPQEAAKQLVAEAKAHGGADNITVVVVDVVDDDDKAAVASAALAEDPGLVIPSEVGKVATESAPTPGGRSGRGGRIRRGGSEPKGRVLTFRVVAFVALVLVLLGGAVAAVAWYARSTYYVGVDQASGELIIFQGRPGGLLWFKPTVAERTGVHVTAMPASAHDDLVRGIEEASLAEAHQYLNNLQTEARNQTLTTITGTTTTSIAGTVTTTVSTGVTAPGVAATPLTTTTVP